MILWIDLETTGTDPVKDDIIEVGAILTSEDKELSELSRFHQIYKPGVEMARIDPAVFQMHTKNGLWQESLSAHHYADDTESIEQIMDWLARNRALDFDFIGLGGSGVSHFDRFFIEQAWPAVAKLLTFYAFDVGAVRRLARIGGMSFGTAAHAPNTDPKNHRAIDDIVLHLEEARDFVLTMADIKRTADGPR